MGRLRVLHHVAGPLAEEPVPPHAGHRLVAERDADATTRLAVVDDSGSELGTLVVYARDHGDPFYGRWSRPDDRCCYASALLVRPEARGLGLGTLLMLAGRNVSAGEDGRGLKCFVAPDNAPSLRCHRDAGYVVTDALTGIRVGPRVLWTSRRRLATA